MRTRTTLATIAAAAMVLGTALTSYASVVATPTRPCAQPNGRVDAMAFSGGTLYIGGSFSQVKNKAGVSNARAGLAAIDTASCDLTAWTAPTDGTVLDLVVSGTTVYAGGTFKHVDGLTRNRLAALDADTASVLPFAPVFDKQVNTLLVSDSTLYAGGKFTKVGTTIRNRLAAFDLGTGELSGVWRPNANGDVGTLALGADGTDVYVGGSFTTLNGHPEYAYLGAVNAGSGDSDNDFLPASGYPVLDLEVDARGVYAGGGGHGGHLDIYNLDGTHQQPTYQTDGNVQAVALDGDSLWAGGHFTNFCVGGTGAGAPFICDVPLLRRKALEISLSTGELTSWAPKFNSPFGLLVARVDPATHALWAGGDFTTVNGVSLGHLATFPAA
jgi:hypothetical protein